MAGRKMDGDEDQKRAAARAAREAGESPSAAGVTTGASRQVRHLTHQDSISHEERAAQDRGLDGTPPAARRSAGDQQPEFPDRGDVGYGPQHEQVFGALQQLEAANEGNGAYLEDVAPEAGLPVEDTRLLLHDLVTQQKLVTELEGVDAPDLGTRYTTRARL